MEVWKAYCDLRMRNLYRHKWLSVGGMTATETAEVMRKFKVYINRLNGTSLRLRVERAQTIDELTDILAGIFDNEWVGHIKSNYKEMPTYFQDYGKFLRFVQQYPPKDGRLLYWPNGEEVTVKDILFSAKTKHNHIEIEKDGVVIIYSGFNALREVCLYIGAKNIAMVNYTTMGEKLLTRYTPIGKEKKYKSIGDGWYLCTMGETIVKLRLIKIICEHFHVDIKARLV